MGIALIVCVLQCSIRTTTELALTCNQTLTSQTCLYTLSRSQLFLEVDCRAGGIPHDPGISFASCSITRVEWHPRWAIKIQENCNNVSTKCGICWKQEQIWFGCLVLCIAALVELFMLWSYEWFVFFCLVSSKERQAILLVVVPFHFWWLLSSTFSMGIFHLKHLHSKMSSKSFKLFIYQFNLVA